VGGRLQSIWGIKNEDDVSWSQMDGQKEGEFPTEKNRRVKGGADFFWKTKFVGDFDQNTNENE